MPHSGRRSRVYLVMRIARLRDVRCDCHKRRACVHSRRTLTHVDARWQRSFSKPCNSCIGLPWRRSQSLAEFAFVKAINVVYGNRSLRAGFELPCAPDREDRCERMFRYLRDCAYQWFGINSFLNLKDEKQIDNLFSQDVRLFSQLVNYAIKSIT